eukprot:UN06888
MCGDGTECNGYHCCSRFDCQDYIEKWRRPCYFADDDCYNRQCPFSPNRGDLVHGEICEGDGAAFMAPFNSRHKYDEGTFFNMAGNLGLDMYYSPPGIDSDLNNCGDYDVYKKVCSSVLFRMKFNTSRCTAPGIELSDIRFYDYMYNEVYPVFMNSPDAKPLDDSHTYENLMADRPTFSHYITGDGSSEDLPLCGGYFFWTK